MLRKMAASIITAFKCDWLSQKLSQHFPSFSVMEKLSQLHAASFGTEQLILDFKMAEKVIDIVVTLCMSIPYTIFTCSMEISNAHSVYYICARRNHIVDSLSFSTMA